jgi:RNA-binding protein
MLNGKQRRHLRSLGHHLEVVIHLGKEGVSPAVTKATNDALEQHELIKVKVLETAPDDRHEMAEALATACKAELAGVLGRTALLYRRRKKDPKIRLPKADEG